MRNYLRLICAQFYSNKRGNVTIIGALAMLPVMLAIATGLDYVSAARKWTKLNAIADAAALAAASPSMLSYSATQAQTAAVKMFMAQAASVPDVQVNASNVSATVTDVVTATGTTRNAIVSYTASRNDTFATLLGRNTITLQGQAASTSSSHPNINFYLLMDTSPSMAIAATQTGINQLASLTPSQGGCAFACHETNPAADNLGNPNGEDNYALARNNGITLRIDVVSQAVQSLIDSAQSAQAVTNAQYNIGLYTFDYGFSNISPLSSNFANLKAQAASVNVLTVHHGSYIAYHNYNNDEDTDYDDAMNNINTVIMTPGNGTSISGDSPQAFLFLISDGVVDEYSAGRNIASMGGSICTTIKNRGIKIAVLYTTYYPLPSNAFYNTNVAPFQPNIPANLQTCASPGFFFQVDVGGDITSALNTLFGQAVGMTHLTR